jgi:hypothetical protein
VSRFAVVPSFARGYYQVRQFSPYRYSHDYRIDDAIALADWLDEREAGYPFKNVT